MELLETVSKGGFHREGCLERGVVDEGQGGYRKEYWRHLEGRGGCLDKVG